MFKHLLLTLPFIVMSESPPAPEIDILTTSFSIGDVIIGSSGSRSFAIRNEGTADLIISQVVTDNPCFKLYLPSTIPQAVIAPGNSQVVLITFRPISTGEQIATVSVFSNDKDESILLVTVRGNGIFGPDISLDTTFLSFGSVYIDSTLSREFIISNIGPSVLIIHGFTVRDSLVFSVSPRSTNIFPGESDTVWVTFTPKTDRNYIDTLTILNNDSLVTVILEGEGVKLPFFHSSSGNIVFKPNTKYHEPWFKLNYPIAYQSVFVFLSTDNGKTFKGPWTCVVDGGIFKGLIPAYQEGSTAHYYFEILVYEGDRYYLPEGAPEQLYSLKVAFSGDVNSDGKTNIFDLLELLRHLSGSKPPSTQSDINKDGVFNIFDLLALLQSLSAQ